MLRVCRKIGICVFLVFIVLSVNAMALTQQEISFVKDSAIELCRGGNIKGDAKNYRIEGDAEFKTIIIKKIFEAGVGGKIELSGEEWNGIRAVIPDQWDASSWNQCVIPTLEFLSDKLEQGDSSKQTKDDTALEKEIWVAVQAMEWLESRCGSGVTLVVPFSAGGKSDYAARSFFAALGKSGVKPLGIIFNRPRVFIENGSFSVEKFDNWQRTNIQREGCALVVVPDYVQDRFPKPHFNVYAQGVKRAIVLPRGTLTEVTNRWNVVFKKANIDPDFVREINRSDIKVELIKTK